MSEEQETPVKSRYRRLVVPDFSADIPPHLMGKLTEEGRWLVETLSEVKQGQKWMLEQILESNRIDIDTDNRVSTIENWKGFFSGKVAIVTAIVLIVLSGLVGAIFKTGFEYIFHGHASETPHVTQSAKP